MPRYNLRSGFALVASILIISLLNLIEPFDLDLFSPSVAAAPASPTLKSSAQATPTPQPLDTTFGFGGTISYDISEVDKRDGAKSVAIQPDGKIVTAGYSHNNLNGSYDFAVFRTHSDGTADETFGLGGVVLIDFLGSTDFGNDVALQSDGKIVVAGLASGSGGTFFGVVRINSDGTLDATFGTGGKVITIIGLNYGVATEVLIQPDGKIVAVGYGGKVSEPDFALVRYNSDGSRDASFGEDGKVITPDAIHSGDVAYGAALQSDGKIVVVGSTHYMLGGFSRVDLLMARYKSDGSLDVGPRRIDLGTNDEVANDVIIQPDGKVLLAGSLRLNASPNTNFALVRYNSDLSPDSNFGTGGVVITDFRGHSDIANAVALQPDGKIVAVGLTTDPTNHDTGFGVARYHSDGSLDTSFGYSGLYGVEFYRLNDVANDVAIQPDGKLVVVGQNEFPLSDGSDVDFALARLLSDSDHTPPTITVPGTITPEATSPAGAKVTYTVSATDDIDPSPSISCTHPSGSTFPLGLTLITCTATDTAQYSMSASFTIKVVDTTAPVLTVSPGRTVNATSPAGALVLFSASATDIADPTPSLVCKPASGSTFPIGATTVNCTATDDSGNATSKTLQVVVLGASEQLANLIGFIENLNLAKQPAKKLDHQLDKAQEALRRGDKRKACGELDKFIQTVQRESGKKLTTAEARQLLQAASQIRTVLGC